MFQHDERYVSDDEDDAESEDESDEENDDDKKNEKEVIRITDLEPSLKKDEEAMNKVNVLLQKKTSLLKCDLCEFEAGNTNGLTMHKKSKHTDKSKQSGYLSYKSFTFILDDFRRAPFGVKILRAHKICNWTHRCPGKKDSYVYWKTLVAVII